MTSNNSDVCDFIFKDFVNTLDKRTQLWNDGEKWVTSSQVVVESPQLHIDYF